MTQHPQADILRAIADGEQIQDTTNYGWADVSAQFALRVVANRSCGCLRIKPATIMLNGTELPKPVPYTNDSSASFFGTFVGTTDGRAKTFYFNTREDRDVVYAKLVEVLNGNV